MDKDVESLSDSFYSLHLLDLPISTYSCRPYGSSFSPAKASDEYMGEFDHLLCLVEVACHWSMPSDSTLGSNLTG